jgi:hypothetical protein
MVAKNYIFGRKYGDNFLTNLVAYYAFENNANDSLVVHNGTLVAGGYTTGINGNAFAITAQNHVITVPDTNDFTFANSTSDLPFSFSVWLYTTVYSADGNRFLSKRQHSSAIEWLFLLNGSVFGGNLFSLNSSINVKTISCANTTSLNTWNHFALTFDGINGTCYINGVAQTTTNSIIGTYSRMQNTSAILRIGSNSTTATNTAQLGRIDELAIWKNRELTATEVAELYTKGNLGNPII